MQQKRRKRRYMAFLLGGALLLSTTGCSLNTSDLGYYALEIVSQVLQSYLGTSSSTTTTTS